MTGFAAFLEAGEGGFAGAGFEEVFVGADDFEDAFVGEGEGGVYVLLEFVVGGHVEGGGDAGIDVEGGFVGVGGEPFVFADEAHGGGGFFEVFAEGGEEALLVGGEFGVGVEDIFGHAVGAVAVGGDGGVGELSGDGFEDAFDVFFEFVGVELEGCFEVEFFGIGGGGPGGEEGVGVGFDSEPAEFGIDVGAPRGLPFFDPGGFADES